MTDAEREKQNELLACITFFLKGACEENTYYGGHSSSEAWDAFAQLTYKVSGRDLYHALENKA